MKRATIALLSALVGAAFPAAPDTVWTRVYGGSGDDIPRSMRLTADGGCIIAGYTRSFGSGGSDVWLLRADSLGDTLWTRTYGGSLDEDAYSLDIAADGGCIVAGYTRSYGAGRADIWLLKVAPSGDTEWTRTFGDTLDDIGYSVQPTADGGYIIAADARDPAPPDYETRLCLLKVDSGGGMVWRRTYEPGIHPKTVLATADGGYTVAARFISGGQEYAWLMQTDSVGDSVWVRRSGSIGLNDIQLRPGGGYIATGVIPGPAVFWLGALNELGHELWGRFYADGTARAIRPVSGGYLATGNATGNRADVYLVRTDTLGDSLWTELIGGSADDIGYAAAQTPDNGFLAVGSTRSFGAGRNDVWLIRLEPEEQTELEETANGDVRLTNGATIVRGVLMFEPANGDWRTAIGELHDISGRRVLRLQPGANDVGGLTPGVYFVLSEPSVQNRRPSTVSKVVVTR